MAKVGRNSHDRDAHVFVRAFCDAGFENIYPWMYKSPDEVVRAVVQKDINVLESSFVSDAHDMLVQKIMDGLKEGVAAIFDPDTSVEETIEFVRETASER